MDCKRAPGRNVKPASVSKSRTVSSLKTKGESDLSTPRASSNSCSGKASGKDLRPKSDNKNKSGGDTPTEEGKLDLMDSSYNSYITSNAMEILLRKSKLKSKANIDKQIATLQKRVSDNLNVLEETKTKVSTLYLLQDQENLLAHHSTACQSVSNDPSFAEGKSYEELMLEINSVKNQLPSKGIIIPELNAEMVNFQAATTQLLSSLERISATYGADESPIMNTDAELQKISKMKASVEVSKHGIDEISSSACASVLNNSILKTKFELS